MKHLCMGPSGDYTGLQPARTDPARHHHVRWYGIWFDGVATRSTRARLALQPPGILVWTAWLPSTGSAGQTHTLIYTRLPESWREAVSPKEKKIGAPSLLLSLVMFGVASNTPLAMAQSPGAFTPNRQYDHSSSCLYSHLAPRRQSPDRRGYVGGAQRAARSFTTLLLARSRLPATWPRAAFSTQPHSSIVDGDSPRCQVVSQHPHSESIIPSGYDHCPF